MASTTASSSEARTWNVYLADSRTAVVVADTWSLTTLGKYSFVRQGEGPVAWFREESVVGIALSA